MEALNSYFPLMLGISFVVIGILYIAMPAESLVKLDRYVDQWVQAAPNPYTRMEVVVPLYKGIGGWVAVSGLVYTLINFVKLPM
jgi:hypothetical protein